MKNQNQTIQLVALAQTGNRQAMNQLAVVVRGRLDEYVGRVTLGSDQAGDIVQETLIVMVKSLKSLRNVERFWPWLYTITANMIRRHYRNEKKHMGVSLSDVGESTFFNKGDRESDAVAAAVAQEMRDNVLECMGHLKENYRMVLAMRCYDRMPYAEIAEAMGQTEFGARRMFCRAKKALAKELTRCGLGRSALVMALLVFGQMSATSKASAAAISITPSLLQVGAAAALSTAVVSQAGMAALVAGGVTIGTATVPVFNAMHREELPIETPRQTVQTWRNLGTGQLDRWFVYPTGSDRQVLLSVTSRSGRRDGYSQWFQTHEGNYFKDGSTIALENYRYWSPDLSVMRLPSDSPELRQFLDQYEGVQTQMEYHHPSDGIRMVEMGLNDEQELVTQVWNHDMTDDERYRYRWDSNTRVEDHRDAMHQRGWTTFRIHGTLDGKRVLGYGQIPLVLSQAEQHEPRLVLEMGSSLTYQDTPNGAQIRDAQNNIVAKRPGGSFFVGLGRPWAGLHSLDTVRRDAATSQYPFTTEPVPETGKVRVYVDAKPLGLIYTVDLTDDQIDSIEFLRSGQPIGLWTFEYHQTVEERPLPLGRISHATQSGKENGINWLFREIRPEANTDVGSSTD